MSADDTGDNDYVPVQLGEIRRFRDRLAQLREHDNLLRNLWVQVAGLYQRLVRERLERLAATNKQAKQEQQTHGTSSATHHQRQHVHRT